MLSWSLSGVVLEIGGDRAIGDLMESERDALGGVLGGSAI